MCSSASGLATNRSRIFRPGTGAMLGTCRPARCSASTCRPRRSTAELTSDLAIGAYVDAVHVVYAGTNGPQTTGNQRFTPASVPGASISSRFGSRLATGRLRRPAPGIVLGRFSLAVSAPADAASRRSTSRVR